MATDPTGLWSLQAHLVLLSEFYRDTYSPAIIAEMAGRGGGMDVIATLDKGKTNYQHYMVPPGMSQEDAKLLAEEFINEQLKLAREARERAKVVADPLPHLEAMREHLELLPNVVFRENFSGDDFGMSCRGFGGCGFEFIS
jgi:hypothetical protein